MRPDLKKRLEFLEVEETCLQRLAPHREAIMEGIERGLDAFYAQVRNTPEVRGFFSGADHIDGAKAAQSKHWGRIASGQVDDDYVRTAERIGLVHARIGLTPRWHLGGYALIIEQMVASLLPALLGRGLIGRTRIEEAAQMTGLLIKLSILDMDYAISSYHDTLEAEKKAQAEERERVSSELARALGDASSTMEEMSVNIRRNAEGASTTTRMATELSSDAAKGSEAVVETEEAMRIIAGKVELVEEVARRTNLLALNAGIEAARAGKHGSGFAVVATEVRKLAEHSAQIAGEIGALSSATLTKSQEAGDALRALVPNIQKTADLISAIASACQEQSIGAEEINTVLQRLDQTSQELSQAGRDAGSAGDRHGAEVYAKASLKSTRIQDSRTDRKNRNKRAA